MKFTSVDEYLDEAPEPQKATLISLRATIHRILPDAQEGLSYNMPAMKVGGKAVAGYAYFKAHCSYFPHSGSVLPQLEEELDGYSWSKGTLKFPVDEPLPEALVRRLVETRLEQLGL